MTRKPDTQRGAADAIEAARPRQQTAGSTKSASRVRAPYGRAMNTTPNPEMTPDASAKRHVGPPPASPLSGTGNTGFKSASDLLSNESRIPAIPISNLVVPIHQTLVIVCAQTGMLPDVATHRNDQSLENEIAISLEYPDCQLPDLSKQPYRLEKDDNIMRYSPRQTATTTKVVFAFDIAPADWQADIERDRGLTDELIEWQATWNTVVRGLSEGTIKRQKQLLARFFSEPFIDDPVTGMRPPTAREVLRPDLGKVIVLYATHALNELSADLAIDLLCAVRRFCRFVCENGAALPSGFNLRELWGPLVCPIGDGDIPKRKPKTQVYLPGVATVQWIYDAALDWAGSQRKQLTAWRTATVFIDCMESGMRGVEARRASLADQLFDRTLGIWALTNPLNIRSAKGGPDRQVEVRPYGWDMLNHWLQVWRPELVGDDVEGPLFPSSASSHEELSSSSLSETSGHLLTYLKERGLLHESFTFHATRKTYATHYLERNGTDVDELLRQCGWLSASQLGVYVRPSSDSVAAQRQQFSRSLGSRRKAA
jgi:integrase